MYVCVYIDRDTQIYIATSTCTCMGGEYAHARDERGQIAYLLLTVIPPHAPAPNQTRPCRNTQASRRALQTPAKIPANEELRLPQKHLAVACSALGSGAGRGSVPRKSLAGRDDFICPVREIASVSESHRGVCNGPSLLVPWHTVASR